MKMISTTYCKRFDNSCYHQCIANWTAVIMMQVLIGHWGEKRCEKMKNAKVKFSSKWRIHGNELPDDQHSYAGSAGSQPVSLGGSGEYNEVKKSKAKNYLAYVWYLSWSV